jgi:hypothetical protein
MVRTILLDHLVKRVMLGHRYEGATHRPSDSGSGFRVRFILLRLSRDLRGVVGGFTINIVSAPRTVGGCLRRLSVRSQREREDEKDRAGNLRHRSLPVEARRERATKARGEQQTDSGESNPRSPEERTAKSKDWRDKHR